MLVFCCICWCKNEDFNNLFDVDGHDNTYYNKLITSVPEMCCSEMNNQRKICKKCCDDINFIYKFHQKCLQSKARLIRYVEQTQTAQTTDHVAAEDIKVEQVLIKTECENDYEENDDSYDFKFASLCHVKTEDNDDDQIIETKDYTCSDEQNEGAKQESTTREKQANVKTTDSPNTSTRSTNILKRALKKPKNATEKQAICHICQKVCTSLLRLKAHMRAHTEKPVLECEVCHKYVTYHQAHLKVHLRTHTGERPFDCSVCHKKFSVAGSLKKHMRIHTGERPYECKVCGKFFQDSGHLSEHMRSHTGERPYECSTCNKKFSVMTNLKKHIRIHTGERPYECSVCEKTFSVSHHLKIHMRIHTGERPYECTMCDKRFSVINNLNSHMKVHAKKFLEGSLV